MWLPNPVLDALRAIVVSASADEMESQLLYFKADFRDSNQRGSVLAKAAICFANAIEGSTVLGILNSKHGPEAIAYNMNCYRGDLFRFITNKVATFFVAALKSSRNRRLQYW